MAWTASPTRTITPARPHWISAKRYFVTQPDPTMTWTLVIHGGAGAMARATKPPEREAAARAALLRALAAGSRILADGGAAVDAVQAAVQVLEDDPHFNAGHGAAFTHAGQIELDAAIMDGKNRRAGAVAAITRSRNPVAAARAVMEQSQHVLLAGPGADAFALANGVAQVEPAYFHTAHRWSQLEQIREMGDGYFDVDMKFGTVGAVARDTDGHVAAATSTGGLTGQRWGRIGDSPLIGAGTYADDRAGAVSATGSGEFYIREGVAHEICARLRLLGEDVKTAADVVQAETKALGGVGGVIVVGSDGTPAWSFNTPSMYRGVARAGHPPCVAIYGDEP